MRIFMALAMVLTLVFPVAAQVSDAPWQTTVSGQIEAFQAGDGAAALGFAAAGFKAQFRNPEAFIRALAASGYGPIVAARSYSFGRFGKVSATQVIQVVKLVGPDQALYEALYQLVNEPSVGWRVQGVMLRKEAGIGV